MKLDAQHNSQVEFDVGGCDFEKNGLDLDNIAEMANDLFSKPEMGVKEPTRCEN